MKNIDISIIILTKNEVKNIENCLNEVFSQHCPFNIEVIVIDSGSTDGTIEAIQKFPVRLIRIKPVQFHHAITRNYGASLAKGEILVYLGGDACPCNNIWLSKLISCLDEMNVAAVYGKQIPSHGINPVNQFRLSWNYGERKIIKSHINIQSYGTRAYYFSTVNCAIRKSIWEKFNFPENVPVYEDNAFIKNVINTGYKVVYEPEAQVYHGHNYSIPEILQRYFDTGFIYNYLGVFERSKENNKINKEGILYLKKGISYLFDNGHFYWIPYFILYTALGFVGLNLGKHDGKFLFSFRKILGKYSKCL